jgi:serine/threonine protein kinase
VAEGPETVLMRLGDDRHDSNGDPDAMIGARVGPLTLVRLLGEGATGRVYVGEHTVLQTLRAVKLLSPPLTQDAVFVRRFVNEARAIARLCHRNLIQVHDVGQLPSGEWFMVLDYLDGQTLGCYMTDQAGPIPVPAILRIACEIANGLQVAHDHKIIHRDLQPDNVFLLTREGDPHQAVVLDFGIARLGDATATGPEAGTRTGSMIGAPAYMAPEQLRGTKVSPATDIYALGVIVYRMSTGGWFPYQATDESQAGYRELAMTELYHRQMTRPPVDPRDRCAGLSTAWASVILAALSPDPAQRPASMRGFTLRLAEAVPAVGQEPGGLAIVRKHAHELVEAGGQELVHAPRSPAHAGSRYQLGEQLGTGGMAEVFVGTMIGIEGFARQVAIKRVLAGLSQVPAFATMFVAEAQIVSQLAHPNIVSVLDFSRDVEDRLFLVMEYVEGKDLASLLHTGPIGPSLAIFILVEMLRGLGYAHARPDPASGTQGVVHRDVSPQNVLLSYAGAVKLSDFGLAKARDASEGVWSETVRGKPSYMAPEQIAGDVLDGRTDLYSVGVMLWEMLARRPLFAGTSKEILGQVMYGGIDPPSSVGPEVPEDLEAVAMRLLERDRSARFSSADATIEALLRCAHAPRDGRGELVQLLADRFPKEAKQAKEGTREAKEAPLEPEGVVITAPPPPLPPLPSPPRPGGDRITAPALPTASEPSGDVAGGLASRPPPLPVEVAGRSYRGLIAVTLWTAVVAGLAAVILVVRNNEGEAAGPSSEDGRTMPDDHRPRSGSAGAPGRPEPPGAREGSAIPMTGGGERARIASPDAGAVDAGAVDAGAVDAGAANAGAANAGAADARAADAGAVDGAAAAVAAAIAARAADGTPAPTAVPNVVLVRRSPAGASPGPRWPHREGDRVTRTGELAIIVSPWAVIWLDDKRRGQTPFREDVPAGRYRLRLTNDEVGQDEIMIVTVEPDRTETIERSW